MTIEIGLFCPFCGKHNTRLDAAYAQNDPIQPRNGDMALCISCFFPARFEIAGEITSLRPLSESELTTTMRESPDSRQMLTTLLGPNVLQAVGRMNKHLKSQADPDTTP